MKCLYLRNPLSSAHICETRPSISNMEENKLPKVTHRNCPNCGSPEVGYSAEQKKLLCTHCKFTWDLPRNTDKIVERKLGEGFNLAEIPKGFGLDTKISHCNGCGSEISLPATQVNTSCPFCGSTKVNDEAMNTNVIQPAGVMPFTFPQKQALAKFKEWIKEGWFHPNDLTALAQLEKIRGVYLPFWTYDAHTESTWTAESGYHYYETETYTDADGNTQTRQIQRTNWLPSSGYLSHFFDDVTVVASKGISQKDIETVYPFNLGEVVNYDSQYILGWDCEVYQREVKEGFEVANGIMDKHLYDLCGQRVPGDTYRFLRVSTHKADLTFKHILLPIWIAAYMYGGKTFQFLVNGQTGAIHGDKPYSPWKIAFAVIAGTLVIGLIAYLFWLNNQ